ncbi:MAG: glutamate-cysteine ligase family protein [Candidatus Brocadiia bacterium]
MCSRPALRMFEGYGVELEYMIVRADNLDVLPIADRALQAASAGNDYDVEDGGITWSNELVLHVIELKTTGPATSLNGLQAEFARSLNRINGIVAAHGARLMPGAMHPWMDPATQTVLWPHDCNVIYSAFNRVFDCRGHGWSNLQSAHLNLPWKGRDEFGRLHSAIRLVLPLLPALAASSPIVELHSTGLLDNRIEFYRNNSARIPSVCGSIIPEPILTPAEYKAEILERIYRDMAPYDPDGILRHEYANARGAIARFIRNTIEVRLLDVQECPAADLAILQAVCAAIRMQAGGDFATTGAQAAMPTEALAQMLLDAAKRGENAVISDARYLALWGQPPKPMSAAELWALIIKMGRDRGFISDEAMGPLQTILSKGTLSTRILRALGGDYSKANVARTYGKLCDCLAGNEQLDVN